MDEDKLYGFLSVLVIVAIIAVIVLIFSIQTTESFTELYFEDHQELPSTIELGETYTFQFSIHNLEQDSVDYPYNIYMEIDGIDQTLNEDSIILSNNQTATITETFTITNNFDTAKIIVESNDQEIYFWVELEE
jgi:uncharacterized membrane protein